MPGVDTGCSALVAVLSDTQLCVANAGVSRCILCRAGRAVDVAACQVIPVDVEEEDGNGSAEGLGSTKAFGKCRSPFQLSSIWLLNL